MTKAEAKERIEAAVMLLTDESGGCEDDPVEQAIHGLVEVQEWLDRLTQIHEMEA